ncbi:MAG: division/cell wall cluster transcriptional repressor MraZ [Acidobacteria bacterium]|nr:MAG: division/cell wall cluster transcriptional repressor MraZ [Acidobacteriota bacterium]
MLRGNHPATIDPKGRLKIPAAFKSILDESYGPDFYITSLNGQSVRIYPMSVWKQFEVKLAALPSMNKSKRKLLDRTNYWGQAEKMDGQGRILIPSMLREAAEMTGEVAVMGNLNYLEVWNLQRFRDYLEKNPLTDEDEETLSNLGV